MALYHTYRPQKFADIIGQEPIVQTITRQIESDTVSHAYLFSGSRGVGKTTTARILAKAVNCLERKPKKAEPCNTCAQCMAITQGHSIDVIEIDAASNTGVDNVRENIIENTHFQPTTARFKVFIIDEVHMLSTSAFNALLKTLEEPPKYVIFVLATTEIHKIPETILSRCQKYTFPKVSLPVLMEKIESIAKQEKITLEKEILETIALKSDGCVRDAVSLLEQLMSLGETHITRENSALFLPISPLSDTIAFLENVLQKNATDAFRTLHDLETSGHDMQQFFDLFLETLRALMITKVGSTQPDLPKDIQDKLQTLCTSVETSSLIKLIDIALLRRQNFRLSSLASLPLELLVLEYAGLPEGRSSQEAAPILPEPPSTPIHAESPPVVPSTPQEPTPEKKKEPPKPSATPATTQSLSQKNLQNNWGAIIRQVETQSPSLVSLLKISEILSLEGKTLTLAVPYKLHLDKLSKPEYRQMIEEAIEQVTKTALQLEIIIQPKETPETSPGDLDNLAAAFGGVVV